MLRPSLCLTLFCASGPALAQQTSINLITQSDDAFGRAVGNERIGIYSSDEVRGFNPTEAGNMRLEGLYIELGTITPPRLQDGSAVRVGYAARGTPFPSPTGIVEVRMEKFTGDVRANAEFEFESNSNFGGALEAKLPLAGEKLGLALGLGIREADQVHGRNGSFLNWLAGVSWLPAKDSEFILFTSGARGRSLENSAFLFPAGSVLPPEQPRKLQQSQPWAIGRFDISASGGIAKFPLGDFRVEAGLFRTVRRDPENYQTLLLGVSDKGAVANHVVIADGGNYTLATSGEFRVSRSWTGERLRHSLNASIRGRSQDRAFGGQQRIAFGASQAGIQDVRTKPDITLGADDTAHVGQLTYGLQYNLSTRDGSTLSLAVQKASFRKNTDSADPALTDTKTRDAPWLFSASGSLALTKRLTLYGGYVRGLEDGAIAPDIAENRNEAPPALRTRQIDAGLRYQLTPKLALIAGAFEIVKPYYGVDAALRFTNLGTLSNRGVELSLAGTLTDGLTVIAGGIVIDPRISGPEVAAGRIGPRPVASQRARGVFNLDWRPAGQQAWSFDLSFDASSAETADRLNTFTVPGRSNLNLGARYRFDLGKAKVLVRAQVLNAFDSYGWKVNSGGGLSFTTPRSFHLQLIADI